MIEHSNTSKFGDGDGGWHRKGKSGELVRNPVLFLTVIASARMAEDRKRKCKLLSKLSYSTRLHFDIRKSSARTCFARSSLPPPPPPPPPPCFVLVLRSVLPRRSLALRAPPAQRSTTLPLLQSETILSPTQPTPVLAGLRFLVPILSVHTASFAHNLRRKLSPDLALAA